MGATYSAKTTRFKLESFEGTANCSTLKLGEGGCRMAFEVDLINSHDQYCGKGVIKYYKDEMYALMDEFNLETTRLQSKLMSYVTKFIAYLRRNGMKVPKITMNDGASVKLVNRGGFYLFWLIKINNTWKDLNYHIERKLNGVFDKFNSNSGWENEKYKEPTALSHFSWLKSRRTFVIHDLQGVFDEKSGYILTDPAISSIAGQFGITDIQFNGIISFLKNHKCNIFCKNWPMANRNEMLAQAVVVNVPIRQSTTYSFMFKLTDEQKYILAKIYQNYIKNFFNKPEVIRFIEMFQEVDLGYETD